MRYATRKIPAEVKEKPASFFTLTVENDLFGDGADQNYTNGIRATFYNTGAELPHFTEWLDRYIPTFDINDTTFIYYSLGQNLYTPEDISAANPNPNDRPYAAFLYGSAGLSSTTDNHIDDIEVTLGIVGPWAFGEEAQDSVHDLINTTDPNGWDYQLENEPGFMLSWQRRWPEAYAADIGPFYARVSPHTNITLGNVYTYAGTELSLQMTPYQYKWQSQPLRVKPAIPGNGYFNVPENKFAWSLFAGVEGRAIGRNIFLDGNSFESSRSVDKKHFVADANAGIALTYGHTQISYTLNWRSKEFEGQSDSSLFGAISIGRRF